MNRIDDLFGRLRKENRRALMPFLTAGDPDLETTAALLTDLLGRRGASMVELGIPYSDPIADGPVVTASYTRALRKGITPQRIFESMRAWRAGAGGPAAAAGAPVVAMVSFTIVHRWGPGRFLARVAEAGLDGLIVPDLPVEEAERIKPEVDAHALKLIQLVTPTTPRERAARIAESSSGFLYYVSVAGITGERRELPPELVDNVAWLKSRTALPICVGFGISRPEQIAQLAPVADGMIVGSAIVRRIADLESAGAAQEAIVEQIGRFVEELAAPLTISV
jgi:tryptophan synthase alpha chain